ncbi:unnamed protein product [Choristocarpus tenellus]
MQTGTTFLSGVRKRNRSQGRCRCLEPKVSDMRRITATTSKFNWEREENRACSPRSPRADIESIGKECRERDDDSGEGEVGMGIGAGSAVTGSDAGDMLLPRGEWLDGERGRGEDEGKGRRIFLRLHKFVFQWELTFHFSLCILSIAIPFALSGSPWLAAPPLLLWCFYNAMFVVGAKRASVVLPSFDRFKRSFVASMEEFLPPRLIPVLSLSFLSVVIAVTLTAARLGGPPLCLSTCAVCLKGWSNAQPLRLALEGLEQEEGQACGYANGKELLAFYTMSQSAILIYLAVMVGLLTCLAWKVSDEELAQRQAAESWLKGENPRAFEMREQMIYEHGPPGGSVRPETTRAWLMFGFVAAFTFTMIGWRKWGDLPGTLSSIIVVGVNVATVFVSILLLHVGFYGRLIALYQGNLHRVCFLSKLLKERIEQAEESWVHTAQAWWSLRNFVLKEDLSLDYDVGGLGVSATFFIVFVSFLVAITQVRVI